MLAGQDFVCRSSYKVNLFAFKSSLWHYTVSTLSLCVKVHCIQQTSLYLGVGRRNFVRFDSSFFIKMTKLPSLLTLRWVKKAY